MTLYEKLYSLLKEHQFMRTKEIYEAVGRPIPLIYWVKRKDIFSVKTHEGLVYFLPENADNLPLEYQDLGLLKGESKAIGSPGGHLHKSKAVERDYSLSKEEIRELIELSRSGVKILEVKAHKPVKRAKIHLTRRERYRIDPVFREKCKADFRNRYHSSPKVRKAKDRRQREHYALLRKAKIKAFESALSNIGQLLNEV